MLGVSDFTRFLVQGSCDPSGSCKLVRKGAWRQVAERGGRILTDVFVRESEGVAFANARIAPGSNVVADMIAHWDLLDP